MSEFVKEAKIRMAGKTYTAPAIVNVFLPGVGQMMKGQVFGGLLILIVVAVGYAMFALVVPILVALVLHIGSIVTAYKKIPHSAIYHEAKRIELERQERSSTASSPSDTSVHQNAGIYDPASQKVSAPTISQDMPVKPPLKGWGLVGAIINKNRGY